MPWRAMLISVLAAVLTASTGGNAVAALGFHEKDARPAAWRIVPPFLLGVRPSNGRRGT